MMNLTLESEKHFPMEGSAHSLETQSVFSKVAAMNSGSFNPSVDMELKDIQTLDHM